MNELVSQSQLELIEAAKDFYASIRELVGREFSRSDYEPLTDEQYLEKLNQMIVAAPVVKSRLESMQVPAGPADIKNGLSKIMGGRPRAMRSVERGSPDEMMRAIWGRLFSEEVLILKPSAGAVEMACRAVYLDNDKWSADKFPNISEIVAAVKEAQHQIKYPIDRLAELPEIRERVADRIKERERVAAIKASRNLPPSG